MTNKAATEKKFTITKDSQFNEAIQIQADRAMRELDRVKRWKKIHALLRKTNKEARKEQQAVAKDAKYFRDEKLVKTDKSETMGLRWGVSLPPITYHALVTSDIVINGKSDLRGGKEDTLDPKGSNQLVKDLEKAFPQYKVAK